MSLSFFTSLQDLNLSCNNICGHNGASAIPGEFKFMTSLTSLQKLDLYSNMIGSNGATALSQCA